jgi:protein TonB
VDESLRSRGLSIALSCLLHLGLAIGLVLGQQWVTVAVAVRPPVLPVQLVTLDAREEITPEPPAPPKPAPRQRIRPPRLLEPPRPVEAPAAPAAEPPQPVPITPVPAPTVAAPFQSPPPGPSMEAVAAPGPPASAPPSIGTAAPSSVPAAPATAAARPPTAAPEGLTQAARPKGGYQVRPAYPAAPRRLGIQGTTLLRVHVLADGRIGDVLVEESAGHRDLDEAAADAVRRWRFEPARRGTEAVAMWVLLPVQFRLR